MNLLHVNLFLILLVSCYSVGCHAVCMDPNGVDIVPAKNQYVPRKRDVDMEVRYRCTLDVGRIAVWKIDNRPYFNDEDLDRQYPIWMDLIERGAVVESGSKESGNRHRTAITIPLRAGEFFKSTIRISCTASGDPILQSCDYFISSFDITGSLTFSDNNGRVDQKPNLGNIVSVCPDSLLTLTCRHNNIYDGATTWGLVQNDGSSLKCANKYTPPQVVYGRCSIFSTIFDSNDSGTLLTSTAMTNVTQSLDGTVVQCLAGGLSSDPTVGRVTIRVIDTNARDLCFQQIDQSTVILTWKVPPAATHCDTYYTVDIAGVTRITTNNFLNVSIDGNITADKTYEFTVTSHSAYRQSNMFEEFSIISNLLTPSGTPFNSTSVFTCKPGYVLIGSATRTCISGSSWTSPTCDPVDCNSLTQPDNGRVNTVSGTTFMKEAAYACDTDYVLNGSVTRTCGPNGLWSSTAPSCDPVYPGVVQCAKRWASHSSNSLTVTWSPPLKEHGNITMHVLKLVNYGTEQTLLEVSVSATVRQYTLNGQFQLADGVPYTVEVFAKNNAGRNQEACMSTDFNVQLAPPKIQGLQQMRIKNGTSIIITWRVPSLAEARGFVSHTVTFEPSSISEGRRQISSFNECSSSPCGAVSVDAGGMIITGLDPSEDYQIRVVPTNEDGLEGEGTMLVSKPLYQKSDVDGGTTAGITIAVLFVTAGIATYTIIMVLVIAHILKRQRNEENTSTVEIEVTSPEYAVEYSNQEDGFQLTKDNHRSLFSVYKPFRPHTRGGGVGILSQAIKERSESSNL